MKRLSVSRSLCAVRSTRVAAAAAAAGVRRARSPSTCTRTPCSASSLASRAMYSSSSDISAWIFHRRPLPVLLREREEREHFQPRLDRPFDDLAHRLHPRPVAQRPRQIPLACPPTIPIHDDGNVTRDTAVEANTREQFFGFHGFLNLTGSQGEVKQTTREAGSGKRRGNRERPGSTSPSVLASRGASRFPLPLPAQFRPPSSPPLCSSPARRSSQCARRAPSAGPSRRASCRPRRPSRAS